MASLKRTFAAASRTVQTPYICASCRSQPIARFARRSASTKTVTNPEDALAATEPATSQLTPTSSPVSSQVRFNDPSEDPNYVPATTWTGLERVGTKAWQRKMRDTGDKFEGWSRRGRQDITPNNIDGIMSKIREALGSQAETIERRPVADAALKRQLVSSVAHITGVRLPDFNIQQPISLRDVRRLLLQKPKTKTLDASKTKEAAALPNVKVSLKRETSRDKDIAIGRWKLISKALKERNLPVYDYQRTKEKKLL